MTSIQLRALEDLLTLFLLEEGGEPGHHKVEECAAMVRARVTRLAREREREGA